MNLWVLSRRARPSRRVAMAFAVVAGVCALGSLLSPLAAEAQGRRGAPATGRYVAGSGQSFTLDTSGSRPLLRFERSTEIWVLRPTPAPRGDILYRNDNGDQILRVTPDGGMTLYTTSAPQGSPVSRAGDAASLLAPSMTAVQMWNYIVRQSGRASSALGRLIQVDVDIQPGSEAVAADALSTAVDAIVRMARSSNLRAETNKVRRIVVTDQGGASQATLSRGTLRIAVNPRAGVAGRPSSARIVRLVADEALSR